MNAFCFPPPGVPSVAVAGTEARFPVHRIYCVGRNYADHVREMGNDPQAEPPVFFMKPADALAANGASVPYPPATSNLHHEIELVVALQSGGREIAAARALSHVFGYAAATISRGAICRAPPASAVSPGIPPRASTCSAPLAALRPAAAGHVAQGRIWLKVNDVLRQESDVSQMLWDVPHIIAALSQLYELRAGDLIFTGTPAGVGPLKVGDRVEGGIEGLEVLRHSIGAVARD